MGKIIETFSNNLQGFSFTDFDDFFDQFPGVSGRPKKENSIEFGLPKTSPKIINRSSKSVKINEFP